MKMLAFWIFFIVAVVDINDAAQLDDCQQCQEYGNMLLQYLNSPPEINNQISILITEVSVRHSCVAMRVGNLMLNIVAQTAC